jgi:hypothetical protein
MMRPRGKAPHPHSERRWNKQLIFAVLVLSQGGRYLAQQVGIAVAVAVDLVWVVLFACYLLGARALVGRN